MKNLLFIGLVMSSIFAYGQTADGSKTIMQHNETFDFIVRTIDSDTKESVGDVQVYLYESSGENLVATSSTVDGYATFTIDPNKEYEVRTCHTGYFKNGLNLAMCPNQNKLMCMHGANGMAFVAAGGEHKPNAMLMATLSLSPMNIGSVYELENVYYDLDKAFLRKKAKRELDELADIMRLNESITIELSSHTDSRGSDAYNKRLSERRANSCYKYLISKGISADRITPVGYGETRPVNECTNGVACDENKHQQNRRTEIEILTYEPIACGAYTDVKFAKKTSCALR